MYGFRYFVIAAVLVLVGISLPRDTDVRQSGAMVSLMSKMHLECEKHSFMVGDVRFGCQSFADVRKIDMRADNRYRSADGDRLVHIGR